MSKNIDDVVDGVIPQDINNFLTIQEKASWKAARMLLKQAIQDKKLCLPMSVDEIKMMITRGLASMNKHATYYDIAIEIHNAQFNRGEK